MSAERRAPKPFSLTDGKDAMSEMLDFGPDPVQSDSSSLEASDRIRRILKQLEDLNQRIDRLNAAE